MELGYFTMPLHPPGSDMTKTLEDDLDQIVTLDRLGYQEAWIGEHFTAQWENIPAPDLFIAQALALTKDIVLGTGVTLFGSKFEPLNRRLIVLWNTSSVVVHRTQRGLGRGIPLFGSKSVPLRSSLIVL